MTYGKYKTKQERKLQHKIRKCYGRIRYYDKKENKTKKDYKKRQELQRIAIVLMKKLPQYKPRTKWWL